MDVALSEKVTMSKPVLNHRWLGDICVRLFSSVPSHIQALGEGSNNCQSFKLRIGDKWVKCYECESAERAQMVRQATRYLEDNDVPIPRIYDVVDNLVFSEWVKGPLLVGGSRGAMIRKMTAYQAQLHHVHIPQASSLPCRFMHLEWLLERMRSVAGECVAPKRFQALSQAIMNLLPLGLKAGIVQPDFIASNIVTTATGKLCSVDNEFLGIGVGFEFDILNASHSVASENEARRQQYINAYAAAGDLGTLIEHRKFWDICFVVKLVGKQFLIGDRQKAKECLGLLERKVQDVS